MHLPTDCMFSALHSVCNLITHFRHRCKQLYYPVIAGSGKVWHYIILTDPCCFILCQTVSSCLFQRVMDLEADAVHHEIIFVDEASFPLAKTRGCGRNWSRATQNGIVKHNAILIQQCTHDHIYRHCPQQTNS